MENIVVDVRDGRRSSVVLGRPEEPAKPPVVMLHGFPDNNLTFKAQLPDLLASGFPVVCPMLPGYEPRSLYTGAKYDLISVGNYLDTLFDKIKQSLDVPRDQPIHLVGHDWGALVGYAMVCTWPEKFLSFTSITIPYGLSLGGILVRARQYLPASWYIQLFQCRGFAERLMLAGEGRRIRRVIDGWNGGWKMPDSVKDDIVSTLAQPGVLPAALAYYRAIYGLGAEARRSRKLLSSNVQVPTLQIRGARDGCITAPLWRLNESRFFEIEQKVVEMQAGHFPHQQLPKEFNKALLGWLQSH